jgi:rhodanese-related sulfurtransferase
VTPAELHERRREVQIVDVRWPNEWEADHIEGASHIPQDELDDRLEEIDRGRTVVTVCRSGSRSAAAADQLRVEGFRAENLDGGMQGWADEGFAVTTGAGEPGVVVDPEPPPDNRPPEHQRLQAEFMSLVFEIEDHFGGRAASEDEVRAYLRQRLIDEGRTPEEADEFLVPMDQSP